MQLQPQLLKRHSKLWLNQQLILQELPELSEEYLRTSARFRYRQGVADCFKNADTLPDTGKHWRYSQVNGSFYYCYDNIPADKKSVLPAKADLETLLTSKQSNTSDIESYCTAYVNKHYTAYTICYGNCTETQRNNLSKAAASIEALVNYIQVNNYDPKKNTLFIEAAQYLQQTDAAYLPHNFRRLKEKVMEVINGKAIAEAITLPRAGNKNPCKYNDEEVTAWVLQLRESGKNYTNSFIIRKITDLCNLYEKPQPSERWIGGKMEAHNMKYLTELQRYGDKSSHANKYRPYVPLAKPMFAGDCWQVDATRVNIIPHKASEEAVGEARAKNPQYIFMIKVRDLYSGDVLGTEYDYAENRWAYHNALAMAVKEAGYLPYELVFDKFPGHNTEEFKNFVADLQARGVKVTFTSSATGKASLERYFGTLQTVFMQDSDYYYGQGIKTRRRYGHRSEQYLASIRKQAKKQGFDFDAAVQEADQFLNKYRSTKLSDYSRKYSTVDKTPTELHYDSEKPNVYYVEPATIAYLFGLKKVLQIRNGGLLHTEIYKTEFIYRVTDYNVISKYAEVLVCYDLEDLSYCHLYEATTTLLKKYLGTAQDESRVQVYGPDAQWGELNRRKAIIANMNALRNEELLHKKAVGDDIITLLAPGYASKDEYSNAETTYTNNMMAITSSNSNTSSSNDEPDGYEPDVRNEY